MTKKEAKELILALIDTMSHQNNCSCKECQATENQVDFILDNIEK